MVIDASKGVEAQTRKLFKVCVMRKIPIFTFINKMDRDANDTFDLLDEIEKELGIATCPVNWPIGSGKNFKGVFDREKNKVFTYSDTEKGTKEGIATEIDAADTDKLVSVIGQAAADKLMEEIELLDGASAEFDLDEVRSGNLTPVFFGSALTNFGVEDFLQHFLKMTTTPLPRKADIELIDPVENDFSAFVFKIQANMNKAHRDRIAFMRICSGKFDANMEVRHVQGDKVMRLSQPQQIMADERKILDEAYAGDIIGVFDPGIFSIGDTLCMPKQKFQYEGIPTFAPEHFARVRQVDTMLSDKMKEDGVYVADVGQNQIWSCGYHIVKKGKFLTSGGMGTMGYSIPAAMGARLAAPGRQVIAVCGDGSFQMSMMELATIRQFSVPVKIIVLKNNYLGMVREYQHYTYKDHYSVVDLSGSPDLSKLSRAYDMPFYRLANMQDAEKTLDEFLAKDETALLECLIDPMDLVK